MFKMKKNEQNENILCLKGMRIFRIMFTIFKFHPKNFVQKSKNFEHYKGQNRKI